MKRRVFSPVFSDFHKPNELKVHVLDLVFLPATGLEYHC